ncbi:Cellulose biosynthesis protein BcsQ [Pseudobutyrivibrio sp. ACV-2]|uniref:ParA family protein n=1 Tax=Pseudobutyrivibrio sp. ACV-2 TaxID=1520801 RepID=UPI00089B37DD|nr:ParA family protein [Pseudobutyrivibrio sp. ACV-2]SEB04838.1 Cellulose biosynthesis protein BcsQ [Pseudobutyrivibrio sp. ACV-2]
MKTICITTTKGGSAKTTNTVELAGALATYNKKVLCIDVDQTLGLSQYLGLRMDPQQRKEYGIGTSLELLTGNASISDCIVEMGAIDVICGDERYEKAPNFFLDEDEDKYLLKNLMKQIENDYDYDYVFIDHGPQNDIIKKMALIAADEFYITTMISDIDRNEAKRAIDAIMKLQNSTDKLVHGDIKGILLSATIGKSLKEFALEDLEEKIAEYKEKQNVNHDIPIYNIPQSMAVKEAQTYKMPNTMKHKSQTVSRVYYEIADNILKGEN